MLTKMVKQNKVCWVIVLGDFGRSPRMQYHTLSLLSSGHKVYVLAFSGSKPLTAITSHPSYNFFSMPQTPAAIQVLPGLLSLLLKAIFQFLCLLWILFYWLPRPSFAIVQLPPAIPTLLAIAFVSKIRRIPFVLDWHNFAYTLMKMNSISSILVSGIAEFIEKQFAKVGSVHICVSKAMQKELKDNWNIEAAVVYDRPTDTFKRTKISGCHDLFKKLKEVLKSGIHPDDFAAKFYENQKDEDDTLISRILKDGSVYKKCTRPAVIVSSTSWTPDEDFSILLEAAQSYERYISSLANTQRYLYPPLLIVVTGKGPLKNSYMQQISQLDLKNVAFRTLWLEATDYPTLLGAADLGISLHSSSSGVDLPMKILDMFGSGLPVCALNYKCISELLIDGKNGLIFSNAEELAKHFQNLFKSFPTSFGLVSLDQMREYLKNNEMVRWEENWKDKILPTLDRFS